MIVKKKSIRAGTKWFSKDRALFVKRELNKKGIKTKIVKTTKINPLSRLKSQAYLVKKIKK